MNLVVTDGQRMYVERLFGHGGGKQRQVHAVGEVLTAEAAYHLVVDAQDVPCTGQAGDPERLIAKITAAIAGLPGS